MTKCVSKEELWRQWFLSCCRPLARNDYVYLRHVAVNWNDAGRALSFARGGHLMNGWPPQADTAREEMALRVHVFRRLKIQCDAQRSIPLLIHIGSWSGETCDGRNANSLMASLRLHYSARLKAETAHVHLGFDFPVYLALSVALFWNMATMPFGVAAAAKAGEILFKYFDRIVQAERLNAQERHEGMEKLKRVLGEVMELNEEFNGLFAELASLEREFEEDLTAIPMNFPASHRDAMAVD